jgi:hypothetical protein
MPQSAGREASEGVQMLECSQPGLRHRQPARAFRAVIRAGHLYAMEAAAT